MRFHCLMFVRDEGDIIGQCLDHLVTWADAVHVYDTGSTDSTWDIVQDYARRDARVVPVARQPMIFSENLRSMLFDRVRSTFQSGDWIVRTDADEFYHVSPPAFVRERLRPSESQVYLQWYYFRLTQSEVAAYDSGAIDIQEDRKRPIEQRRRMYKIPTYAEPRMFRYRRTMQWNAGYNGPYNGGYLARERIPIRHYPHRDPMQMAQRFALRAAMSRRHRNIATQWALADWRKEIIDLAASPDGSMEQTAGKMGLSVIPGQTSGALHEWLPGTDLPEVHDYTHLQRGAKRLQQRIVYPLLLPVLDRIRPRFDSSHSAVHLSEQENRALAAERPAQQE